MKTLEQLNIESGTKAPASYRMPNLCIYCRQSREGSSMASPANNHPEYPGIRKCALHGCWVHENGVCNRYQMSLVEGTKSGGDASVAGFVNEKLEKSEGGVVIRKTLYERYVGFCKDLGFLPVSESALHRAIRTEFPGLVYGRTAGEKDLRGVAFKV